MNTAHADGRVSGLPSAEPPMDPGLCRLLLLLHKCYLVHSMKALAH